MVYKVNANGTLQYKSSIAGIGNGMHDLHATNGFVFAAEGSAGVSSFSVNTDTGILTRLNSNNKQLSEWTRWIHGEQHEDSLVAAEDARSVTADYQFIYVGGWDKITLYSYDSEGNITAETGHNNRRRPSIGNTGSTPRQGIIVDLKCLDPSKMPVAPGEYRTANLYPNVISQRGDGGSGALSNWAEAFLPQGIVHVNRIK